MYCADYFQQIYTYIKLQYTTFCMLDNKCDDCLYYIA